MTFHDLQLLSKYAIHAHVLGKVISVTLIAGDDILQAVHGGFLAGHWLLHHLLECLAKDIARSHQLHDHISRNLVAIATGLAYMNPED